jgi:hypothetical protein
MASMPRGTPRSVPDPAGDRYDQMIREQNAQPSTEANGLKASSKFTPSTRLEGVRQARPLSPTVTIGGQVYREIDNGSANVLVPVADPKVTDAELAARRQGVERIQAMTQSPIGTTMYGVVGLAGGSQKVQDAALQVGALIDTTGAGIRARPSTVSRPPPPPKGGAATPNLRQSIRSGELNKSRQATGVSATLEAGMLGTGTKAYRGIKPPGWQGDGRNFNEARAHLLAKILGGSGRDERNIVTMTHHGANTPQMRNFELAVADRVRTGEIIEYMAKPLYTGAMAPTAVLLTALGSRGGMSARLIRNPAGARR